MTDKKDDNNAGWTGMAKPVFGINHNPFRSGDSLVDAVRAVLSGKPVTQEQKAELEKQNSASAKSTQEEQVEDASNLTEDDSYRAMQDAKDKAKKLGKVWSKMGQGERDALINPEMKKRGYEKRPDDSRWHKSSGDDENGSSAKPKPKTFKAVGQQDRDNVGEPKAEPKAEPKDPDDHGLGFSIQKVRDQETGEIIKKKTYHKPMRGPHGRSYDPKNAKDVKDYQKKVMTDKDWKDNIGTLVTRDGIPNDEDDRTQDDKDKDRIMYNVRAGSEYGGHDQADSIAQKLGYKDVEDWYHDQEWPPGHEKHFFDKLHGESVNVFDKWLSKRLTEDASNDKSDDGEGLDKVDKKAVKKKFDNRKDKDIDNDGDTDDSDEYLHKKRKAISKDVDAQEGKDKAYTKKHDAKIIATKMKRNKTWFGPKTVAQVSKMKFVSNADLEQLLPDFIPGREIGALFASYEDASNDKSDDGEGLDKVDPKAVKKKFDNRKDKDIDNDGDTDDSDEFLHKRRKAISKSIAKEVKEKAKDTLLVVNPKDPKAKRGGGVKRIKKKEWPALQKKGWILAEDRQAIIYIDPEEKYIEVDFGPAEIGDILVEGMIYERWSIPKMPETNPKGGDNLVAWKHDFADWLGELKPGAKFNISFASDDTVFDFPKAGARNEKKYKFVTKVIGSKVAEVMKALEKVEKIK
jgi:hypothetical protein